MRKLLRKRPLCALRDATTGADETSPGREGLGGQTACCWSRGCGGRGLPRELLPGLPAPSPCPHAGPLAPRVTLRGGHRSCPHGGGGRVALSMALSPPGPRTAPTAGQTPRIPAECEWMSSQGFWPHRWHHSDPTGLGTCASLIRRRERGSAAAGSARTTPSARTPFGLRIRAVGPAWPRVSQPQIPVTVATGRRRWSNLRLRNPRPRCANAPGLGSAAALLLAPLGRETRGPRGSCFLLILNEVKTYSRAPEESWAPGARLQGLVGKEAPARQSGEAAAPTAPPRGRREAPADQMSLPPTDR